MFLFVRCAAENFTLKDSRQLQECNTWEPLNSGIEGKSMVLVGNIFNFSGGAARFRGTWAPDADGSVRQFFELYNNETESWDVGLDGRYVPRQ